MKSWSVIIAGFIFCSAIAFAQEPAQPDQLFSSDLVLWSSMQEPQQPEQDHAHQQPTPDPNPETQPTPNPTPSQPGQQASPSTPASQDNSSAQTFTGTISKESDNYVLKVSDSTSYKLDSQDQVQAFEGKRVQVTGTLDTSINLIHVDKVEPIS